MPAHAITYVIAGASRPSKAIPIQLTVEGSYRLKPYLRMLERAAYTIIASILRSFEISVQNVALSAFKHLYFSM